MVMVVLVLCRWCLDSCHSAAVLIRAAKRLSMLSSEIRHGLRCADLNRDNSSTDGSPVLVLS